LIQDRWIRIIPTKDKVIKTISIGNSARCIFQK
jgi:hypothetical protein